MDKQDENTHPTPTKAEHPVPALIGGLGATICSLIAAYELSNMRAPLISGAAAIIFGLVGFVGALRFAQSQRKQGDDACVTPLTPTTVVSADASTAPDAVIAAHRHALAWFLGMAALIVLAALAAHNYYEREAMILGAQSLVALIMGLLHRVRAARWRMVTPKRRPPVATVSVAGLGLLCIAFGLIVPVAIRGWRGLDLPGDLYLWGGGAVSMGWWLGAAFLLLAPILHVALSASKAQRSVWPWAVSWGLVAFLLGPEIVIERSSPDAEGAVHETLGGGRGAPALEQRRIA